MQFRWTEWNLDHIGHHGVRGQEAEWVVEHANAVRIGAGKYRVRGQTPAGRYLQVIFVLTPDREAFVIHARDLTANEKKAFRRKQR